MRWILRRAAKRDSNEGELVKTAERLGAWVVKAPPLDLWCWHWRLGWVPVEVKSDGGRYTEAQVRFIRECHERGARVLTWHTTLDVLNSLGGE